MEKVEKGSDISTNMKCIRRRRQKIKRRKTKDKHINTFKREEKQEVQENKCASIYTEETIGSHRPSIATEREKIRGTPTVQMCPNSDVVYGELYAGIEKGRKENEWLYTYSC